MKTCFRMGDKVCVWWARLAYNILKPFVFSYFSPKTGPGILFDLG